MVFCAVVDCANRSTRDKEKRFFRLPAVVCHQGEHTPQMSKKRREEWLAKILSLSNTSMYGSVLIILFLELQLSYNYDNDNPDWAPSLILGHMCSTSKPECSVERYERALTRKKRVLVADSDELIAKWNAPDHDVSRVSSEEEQLVINDPNFSNDHNNFYGTPVQTELTSKAISVMESDINKLQKSQEQIETDCRDKVADLEMIVDKLEQKVNDL